ncbi:MAG: radical SAM protein [Clostridia bacterium]|nr:radical SAM protein [Clostridia bacterium]
MAMTGWVHSFESMAAVDGEGLRCAVFLAGCPLRCAYCHNPDTWYPRTGAETDAEQMVRKIARYKPYFGDLGGVTFSGGEPLLQAEWLREMVPLLEKEGIHYVVDTSGALPLTDTVKEVLSGAQSVLLDLKFWDGESYRQYTGQGIERPLETLRYLNDIEKKTRIRTVIVPGINDREELLEKYLSHLTGMACVERYELLGFHTMGFFKYEKLGISNSLAKTPALSEERRKELQKFVDERLSFTRI